MSADLKIPDFAHVYIDYQNQIFRYFLRLTGDWEESRDLTQDVFIKVQTHLSRFEGRSSLSTWIYKIATNVANDRFRSASFKKTRRGLPTDSMSQANEGPREASIDDEIARNEMNECINRYLLKLNENYRTPLVLSEYEGLKNQEIADILGTSLETVKVRIHRGRVQLKKLMEKGCHITPDPHTGLSCDEK